MVDSVSVQMLRGDAAAHLIPARTQMPRGPPVTSPSATPVSSDPRDPGFGQGAFRAFDVTATVYLLRGAELPTTAEEWFAMVDRMGTALQSVVERRYPLAGDVVEQRRRLGVGPRYG